MLFDDLILEYSNYIYGIAKKFRYYDKEDIIQAGFLGLIKASKNYIPGNTKFTTYAFKYIQGEMYKVINDNKLSYEVRKAKRKIEEVKELLKQKYFREPTIKEISDFIGYDVEYLMLINTKTSSLDERYDIKEEINMDDMLSLKEALLNLEKDDLKLLKLSLIMSEKEVGDRLGMNQVKVSRTLKKIRNNIKENMN